MSIIKVVKMSDKIIYNGSVYTPTGKRFGEKVLICYMPRIEGIVVGHNEERDVWLVEHTVPK